MANANKYAEISFGNDPQGPSTGENKAMTKVKEHLVDFSEETQVGWDDQGKPIKAERLSCWVYELLEELAEQAKAG